MLINLVVVVIFALINGVSPSWTWLLVPLSLLELYALSLGISFLLGAINVKYRDVTSIWDVCIQALFYAVPIIYPVALIAESNTIAAKVILLNPISQAIQDIRHNLITPETITTWNYIGNHFIQFLPIIFIVIILALATIYFRRKSKFFAEEI